MYYLSHKEKEKKYQKDNYWKNPEKSRKQAIEYRRANPEKRKEIKSRYDQKHKSKINRDNKEYYLKNKTRFDKVKKWGQFIQNEYGITVEEYETLRINQNNKCGICHNLFKNTKPSIDHIHNESKKIRGLLCRKCNCALGLFKENPDTLSKGIKWLKNDFK